MLLKNDAAVRVFQVNYPDQEGAKTMGQVLA